MLFVYVNVTNAVNDLLLDDRHRHFNADVERNLHTILSVAATLFAAFAAIRVGLSNIERRRQWFLVAATFLYFALDDSVEIHERLGEPIDPVLLPAISGIWFVLYLPLMLFSAWMIWSNLAPTSGWRRVARAGIACLVLAVAAEGAVAVIPELDGENDRAGYTIEVGIEEGAELAGWWLIGCGLTGTALSRRRDLIPENAPVVLAAPAE